MLNIKNMKPETKMLGSPQLLHKNATTHSKKLLTFMEPSKQPTIGLTTGIGYSVNSKLSTNQKLAEKIGETKVSSWSSLHKNKRSMGNKDLQNFTSDKISFLDRAEGIKKNAIAHMGSFSGRRGSIDMLGRERAAQTTKYGDKSNKTSKPKSISATRRGYSSVLKHLFRKSSMRSPRQVASPLKEKIRLMINERAGSEQYREQLQDLERGIGAMMNLPPPQQKIDSSDRQIIFETSMLDRTLDRVVDKTPRPSSQSPNPENDRRTQAVSPPSGKGAKKVAILTSVTNERINQQQLFKKSFTTRHTPKNGQTQTPVNIPAVDFLSRRGHSFLSKIPDGGFISARSKEGFNMAGFGGEFKIDAEVHGTVESGDAQSQNQDVPKLASSTKNLQESRFTKKQPYYTSKVTSKIESVSSTAVLQKTAKIQTAGFCPLPSQYSSNPSPKAATPTLLSKMHMTQPKQGTNKKQVKIDPPLSNTVAESESYLLMSSPSKTPPAKSSVKLLGSRSSDINFVDQFHQQRQYSVNKEMEIMRREKLQLQIMVEQLQSQLESTIKYRSYPEERYILPQNIGMHQSEILERSQFCSHIEEPMQDIPEVRKSLKLGRGSLEHHQQHQEVPISLKPMAFSTGNLMNLSSSDRNITAKSFVHFDMNQEPASTGRLHPTVADHRDSKKLLLKQIESLLDMHTSNAAEHHRNCSLEKPLNKLANCQDKEFTPSSINSQVYHSEPEMRSTIVVPGGRGGQTHIGDPIRKVNPFQMYIRDSEIISPPSQKLTTPTGDSPVFHQQVQLGPLGIEDSTAAISKKLDVMQRELEVKNQEIEKLKSEVCNLQLAQTENKPNRNSPSSRHRSAKSEHNIPPEENLDLRSFREKLARERESRPVWTKPSPRQQESSPFVRPPPEEEYQTHRQPSVKSDAGSDAKRPASLGEFNKKDPDSIPLPQYRSTSLHSFGMQLGIDPLVAQLTEENFNLRSQLNKQELKQSTVSNQAVQMAQLLEKLTSDVERVETTLEGFVKGLHSLQDLKEVGLLDRPKANDGAVNSKLQALQQAKWPCTIEEACEAEEDLDEESINRLVKITKPLSTKVEKCNKLLQNLSLHVCQLEISLKSKDSQLLDALSDLKDRDDLLYSLQEHLDRLEQEKLQSEQAATDAKSRHPIMERMLTPSFIEQK